MKSSSIEAGVGCATVALVCVWIVVWSAVIYAAIHFIRKFW